MAEYVPSVRKKYLESAIPALTKEFSYKNANQVPVLQKVTINMGLGEAVQSPKLIEAAVEHLTAISGQKPVITRAKKSIAGFKLRENMPIGVMVTLRGPRMYEFVGRLFDFALPRVRDFKGTSLKAFDGRGNYTLGIKEQIVFPEIDYDKVEKIKGLNISFVTSATNDEEGRALLRELGMPFRK